MKILLSNDDGYDSEGLLVLEKVLMEDGHQVSVCAPSTQRSASSHSITLFSDIKVKEYAPSHYRCSGTPADCLFCGFGSNVLSPSDYDLVISGINKGYNLSSDMLYSGTVGVAQEAAIWGIKSIAISCFDDLSGTFPFEFSARFLLAHLESFVSVCNRWTFVNINVPANPDGSWKVADLGFLNYGDAFTCGEEEGSYRIIGGKTPVVSARDGNFPVDLELVKASAISVSAVRVLPTVDAGLQQRLQQLSSQES
ncbi:MAG: 5'/3'-nucleotidase SurE [Spirochaetia bacterium]|jgi:5'-nucleotidase|nr:5'/3'-nucleotidase SurE [Spirochaetia bacterium]